MATRRGYPLNALWGFQYAGVWKTTDQFERNRFTKSYISSSTGSDAQLMLGYPKYVDQNRDGILSEEDLIYLGNSDPRALRRFAEHLQHRRSAHRILLLLFAGRQDLQLLRACDGRRLRHQPVPLHARRVASRAQPGFRPAPCGNRRPTGSQFVAGARCLVPASEERHGLLYVRLAEENPPAARHHAWPSRARTSGSGPSTTVSTPTFRARGPVRPCAASTWAPIPVRGCSCSASSCVIKSTRQFPKKMKNFINSY